MAKDKPESKSEIQKLAAEFLENENPGKAIKLLENAEISEKDTELQHMLASAYADRKWGKKAMAQYQRCLAGDRIYPSLIQDYSEFMLDSEEHILLNSFLCELLNRKNLGADSAAMTVAMLCSSLGDCMLNGISTEITPDFFRSYLSEHPEAADKAFFSAVMRNLAGTPNDPSFASVADRILKIMTDNVPDILYSTEFQSAVADFEISLILYSNTVNPLTLLGMRTAKLRFASPSDDTDYLRYLVFDAKMNVVEARRNGTISTEKFAFVCPYLWSLIAKFVTGVINTPDLKKFARDEIYSELRNASPNLLSIFEKNLSADGFAALKEFISSPASAPKPAVFSGNKIINKPVVSSKTAPNSPCPCGSGKKYKKCCGLNQCFLK